MKHIKLFCLLAACCLALASVSCTKENSSGSTDTPGKQEGTVLSSLNGTTWSTGKQMGLGTLTLSFTKTDATLKRVSDGKMTTKGKLLNDQEQDITGTVSGNTMNVTFSKSGNYVFSKK